MSFSVEVLERILDFIHNDRAALKLVASSVGSGFLRLDITFSIQRLSMNFEYLGFHTEPSKKTDPRSFRSLTPPTALCFLLHEMLNTTLKVMKNVVEELKRLKMLTILNLDHPRLITEPEPEPVSCMAQALPSIYDFSYN